MKRLRLQTGETPRAFTLIEVAMSMAIVAIASVTLISALNQSLTMRGETVAREDGTRVEAFIRSQLNGIEFGALYEVLKTNDPKVVYYAYTYRGHATQRRPADSSPVPSDGEGAAFVQGFRRTDDPLFKADLEYRVGEAFKIRMTAFPFDPADTSFELPDEIKDYERSALPVFVEVFQDPLPGEKLDEWLLYRRQLSFPILISRN